MSQKRSSRRLTGQVAIVTGAASGIGAALAQLFGKEGAQTVCTDNDAKTGNNVTSTISQDGAEAVFFEADIRDEEQVKALVAYTVKTYGHVHVLVNNAGILRFSAVESMEREEWEQVLSTNLTGAVLCAKHVIPHMKRTGTGAIVNIASVHAVLTRPGLAAYAASKGGLMALTRNMALELAPHDIRVNAIIPGYTLTPLFLSDATRLGGGDPAKFIRTLEETIPLRRVAAPEEVASAALFAACSESSYMTGAAITIDGGVTAEL